jgi:hypothetical protein
VLSFLRAPRCAVEDGVCLSLGHLFACCRAAPCRAAFTGIGNEVFKAPFRTRRISWRHTASMSLSCSGLVFCSSRWSIFFSFFFSPFPSSVTTLQKVVPKERVPKQVKGAEYLVNAVCAMVIRAGNLFEASDQAGTWYAPCSWGARQMLLLLAPVNVTPRTRTRTCLMPVSTCHPAFAHTV